MPDEPESGVPGSAAEALEPGAQPAQDGGDGFVLCTFAFLSAREQHLARGWIEAEEARRDEGGQFWRDALASLASQEDWEWFLSAYPITAYRPRRLAGDDRRPTSESQNWRRLHVIEVEQGAASPYAHQWIDALADVDTRAEHWYVMNAWITQRAPRLGVDTDALATEDHAEQPTAAPDGSRQLLKEVYVSPRRADGKAAVNAKAVAEINEMLAVELSDQHADHESIEWTDQLMEIADMHDFHRVKRRWAGAMRDLPRSRREDLF